MKFIFLFKFSDLPQNVKQLLPTLQQINPERTLSSAIFMNETSSIVFCYIREHDVKQPISGREQALPPALDRLLNTPRCQTLLFWSNDTLSRLEKYFLCYFCKRKKRGLKCRLNCLSRPY